MIDSNMLRLAGGGDVFKSEADVHRFFDDVESFVNGVSEFIGKRDKTPKDEEEFESVISSFARGPKKKAVKANFSIPSDIERLFDKASVGAVRVPNSYTMWEPSGLDHDDVRKASSALEKLRVEYDRMIERLPPRSANERKDMIKGGKADSMDPSDFDRKQLEVGIKHELEHTGDKDLAKEIAMDHLAEDPMYYQKLKKIEKGSKEESTMPKMTEIFSEADGGDIVKRIVSRAKSGKVPAHGSKLDDILATYAEAAGALAGDRKAMMALLVLFADEVVAAGGASEL